MPTGPVPSPIESLFGSSAAVLAQADVAQPAFEFLADPNVAYVLLVLGFLGFFLELSAPGTSVPGIVGAVSLVLAVIGLSALPFQWQGAILIALAFVLFIADIFLPSLGALTVGGLAALVAGSYLLFDDGGTVSISRPLIWAVTVMLIGLFALLGVAALTVFRRQPATGREGLVGAVGTVRQPLNPDGMVFVAGELWQATAAGDRRASMPPIEANVPVAVTGVDGLRIFVRRATPAEVEAAGVAVIGDSRPAIAQDAIRPVPESS
jgi:membrane-bound serine protease (ClpP class)